MRHLGLKARMAVVGSILFAFYAVAAVVVMGVFDWPLSLVLVGSILFVGVQYKVGKWMALRSVGAEDLPEDRYPQIHRQVESLSRSMGIEKPRLMIASMGVPNAFAVGRKGAGTVVVSEELLARLDAREVEGVLAHELAHIANRDVVMMVLGQGVASIVAIVAQWAVLLSGDNDIADFFLAIVVGQITQMLVMLFVFAISRYREYVADGDAADAIGGGEPLARALEKISSANERRDDTVDQQVNALCIFGEGTGIGALLSTHPPVEKRIRKLRGLMVDVRTLAAAVLGVALGVVCLAAPRTIIQVQTAGRIPQDRYGRYGEDGASGGDGGADGLPTRWIRLVQVVGAVLMIGGVYFGWTLLAAP